MHSFTYLALATAALLRGTAVVHAAEPTTLPGHYVCTSVTTVTTTVPPVGNCDFVCPSPSVACAPGEPSEAPFPTVTSVYDPPSCTVEVEVQERCECPTCVPTA
ncbi:hypothetical protein GGR56DRAFT_644901 [Xylariaceae sp. FL0804]|nr:hypothetical protein GGR56DRAFT_644901 [Xylariaceae sp. FL0804]